MTAITREYLDAIDAVETRPRVRNLIAALRRVVDLRDDLETLESDRGNAYASIYDLDAALAGTRADDGAVTA